jgi:hypothetical protein
LTDLPSSYFFVGLAENASSAASEPTGVLTLLKRSSMCPSFVHEVVQLSGTTAASIVACHVQGTCHRDSTLLWIVNCHLDWGHNGEEQAQELLRRVQNKRGPDSHHVTSAVIKDDFNMKDDDAPFLKLKLTNVRFAPLAVCWCGDFNMEYDAPFLKGVRETGLFQEAFEFRDDLCTVGRASDGMVARVDWILYQGQGLSMHVTPPTAVGMPTSFPQLAGHFSDVSEVLRRVGSDHAPLFIAFEIYALPAPCAPYI